MAVDYVAILNSDREPARHAAGSDSARTVHAAYAAPHRKRSMKHKKKTKAERRVISLRNLKKARAANRRKHAGEPKPGISKRIAKSGHLKKGVGKAVQGSAQRQKAKHAKKAKKARKLTKAERADISRRNLRKARAAQKHNAKPKKKAKKAPGSKTTLTARRAARSTTKSEAKRMKGKKGKKSGKKKAKLTKAERADISRKNLKKARAAQKKKPKKGKKKAAKTLAKRAAKRMAAPKQGKIKRAKRSKGKRSSGKRRTPAQKAASLRNLRKARAVRKAAKKRHKVRPYSYHSKPKRVKVKGHMSWEKRGKKRRTPAQKAASLRNLRKARGARRHRGYEYAMSNPLGGVEVFVGGLSALGGFMVADLVDRIIATHALTAKSSTDAAGHQLYADNPPTTGSYIALFNPTAICAPMNLARWGAGLGMTVVPVVIAKWIGNPMGRSVFQMWGFGAGMRILGKAGIDLVAKLSMWTQNGQRLYDGEMRAQVLASADQTPLASLPSAGLGAADCGCANCKAGVGECGVGKAPAAGTGYPSEPRETAAGAQRANAPPPPPSPPATSSLPGGSNTPTPSQTLQGHPGLAGVGMPNYNWGHKEDRDAA